MQLKYQPEKLHQLFLHHWYDTASVPTRRPVRAQRTTLGWDEGKVMTRPVSLRWSHTLMMSGTVRCASFLWACWQGSPQIWFQSSDFWKKLRLKRPDCVWFLEHCCVTWDPTGLTGVVMEGESATERRETKNKTTQKTMTGRSHTRKHTSSNERYHIGHLQLGMEKCLWKAWSHGKSQKPSVKYLNPLFTHSSGDFWQ